MPRLNVTNGLSWADHRSGWGYVLSLLAPHQHQEGILVDGCLDATFGYQAFQAKRSLNIPYHQDWIGFFHHPIQICPWYYQENLSPYFVLQTEAMRESLVYCKGIFTLSEHLAKFIREMTSHTVQVRSIYHPTDVPEVTFHFKKFRRDRKVIQVGSWMRRLTTFFHLKVPGYQKYMPINSITMNYLRNEIRFLNNTRNDEMESVIMLKHLSNHTYDQLLAQSVVFLDLYDSSANNAVIECIVRNTPLVVNRIPPVIEYLGEDYPLFYTDIAEAESLLSDDRKIYLAHEYLRDNLDKSLFTGDCFMNSFYNSGIFSNTN